MRVDEKATKAARARHAKGVELLNEVFHFDPNDPPRARRKHARHDIRWRRRKITAATRRRNRP
jgi:hypothetical protein